jgi:hypothetical protein
MEMEHEPLLLSAFLILEMETEKYWFQCCSLKAFLLQNQHSVGSRTSLHPLLGRAEAEVGSSEARAWSAVVRP